MTSQLADRYSKFYRSLPSDLLVNEGRLVLLERFEWVRIGILCSGEDEYVSVSQWNLSCTYVHDVCLYTHDCTLNKINVCFGIQSN